MMVICINQHLSNVWSLICEKAKKHWRYVEKSVAYKKRLQVHFIINAFIGCLTFIFYQKYFLS